MENQQSLIEKQIVVAKIALDNARRAKDALKEGLAEAALNDLLGSYRYHGYHTSHQGDK